MLTFVLVIVAGATIFAILRHNKDRIAHGLPSRRRLTALSVGSMAGIFAQAILGGITVLTGLNPLTVASHFLLSIGLISIAYRLKYRLTQPGDDTSTLVVHPLIRTFLNIHVALASAILVLGTLVTGSGPHAGESAQIKRLSFNPQIISWVHADVVLLFLGVTIGLYVAVRATNAPRTVINASLAVLVIGFGQGLIGYVQYFTGLPWVEVALHMSGACLLWIATLALWSKSATHDAQAL